MEALAFLESTSKKVLPIYVLHGDEDFLKRQVLHQAERCPARRQRRRPQGVLGEFFHDAEHVLAHIVQGRDKRLGFSVHHARMTRRRAESKPPAVIRVPRLP